MALIPMKHIEIIALQRDAKKIVELIQRQGIVDISTFSEAETQDETDAKKHFYKAPTEAGLAQLKKHLLNTEAAIEHVKEYAHVKTSMLEGLTGRSALEFEDFAERVKNTDASLRKATKILALYQTMKSENDAKIQAQNRLNQVLPWANLDIPMTHPGTRYAATLIGTLPGEWSQDSLTASINRELENSVGAHSSEDLDTPLPSYSVEIVYSDKVLSCLFVLTHKNDCQFVEQALRSLGFSVPSDPTIHPPTDRIGRMRKRIEDAQTRIGKARVEIAGFEQSLPDLYFLADFLRMRIEKYEALGQIFFTQKSFVLQGFVPARDADALTRRLQKQFEVAVSVREPSADEVPPGAFENNIFVAPVHDIVTSYSPPTTKDIDPNPVMSFFYYLFFGMMLSDAGYGLLLIFGTLFVIHKKKPEGTTRLNMYKFLYCGISSVLWGLLFGSFFGNAVNAVGYAFFGSDIAITPLLFDPVARPMDMLVMSMVLGFIHLLAGLALKFANMWRHGDRLGAIFDVGFWWVLFSGIVLVILNMGITTSVPLNKIGIGVAIAGASGLLLTQGRKSPSIPGKIIGGLASLYNITGYFSDILSYSRLMALGLVTGIVGVVFNTIGTVLGSGILRVFIFIPVFLFGHAVNLGISALGAYVHTNRLQYVEFFSKFYEGGGNAYKPFSTCTKHFKIKEDN